MNKHAKYVTCAVAMGLSAGAAWGRPSLQGDANVDLALTSRHADVREQALDHLIQDRTTTPKLLSHLGVLLGDEDLYIAGKAATALSLRGAAAFATLSGLLERGSRQQRWGAAVALTKTKSDIRPFVPALARALTADDDRLVTASLSALARAGSDSAPALPALRLLLTHKEIEIRWATLMALAAIGPAARAVLPQIMPLLDDAAPELRLAAATATKHIQPPVPIAEQQLHENLAWLKEHIPTLMRKHHVPGVSIAIIQRRQISWAQGFGVSDVRTATPVTVDTIFEACSMSKPILAMSALQLIQQGRLDLDVPLTQYLGHDYLPDQPEQRRITARMALTHRTGLPNWRIGYDEMGGPLAALFAPGSDYLYSGEGILFLQRAMEVITKTSLDRYAQEQLFAPLQLAHTSFTWTQDIERNLASGHDALGAFKERTHYRQANGAYSLYTTPTEYARLMLTLMSPNFLGTRGYWQASIDLLLQRQQRVADEDVVQRPAPAKAVATYRALGWGIDVTADGDIIQHSGSNSSGFRSFGQFNPDKGSGLVIFTNGESGSVVRDAVLARIGNL